MLTRIHVNQRIIRANARTGKRTPVLTIKTSRETILAHEVEIDGPSRIVYSPDAPLNCGARVWVETRSPVKIHKRIRKKQACAACVRVPGKTR